MQQLLPSGSFDYDRHGRITTAPMLVLVLSKLLSVMTVDNEMFLGLGSTIFR